MPYAITFPVLCLRQSSKTSCLTFANLRGPKRDRLRRSRAIATKDCGQERARIAIAGASMAVLGPWPMMVHGTLLGTPLCLAGTVKSTEFYSSPEVPLPARTYKSAKFQIPLSRAAHYRSIRAIAPRRYIKVIDEFVLVDVTRFRGPGRPLPMPPFFLGFIWIWLHLFGVAAEGRAPTPPPRAGRCSGSAAPSTARASAACS
jgi:hypothetical protein